MTDLLRRSHAPLTDRAWENVDAEAGQILKSQLSARQFVDVCGPHGWGLAAVDTGRLQLADDNSASEVPWGIRRVLPLVEVRLPFVLQQMELDAISRGCQDPDLESLQQAAKKAAWFEESAIYEGLPDCADRRHPAPQLPRFRRPAGQPHTLSPGRSAGFGITGLDRHPRPLRGCAGKDTVFQAHATRCGGLSAASFD